MWLCKLFRSSKSTSTPSEPVMKYLIVGLGNIGDKYRDTRHNVGFEVVDHIAEEKKGTWKAENLGSISRVKHKGRTLILLQPSTYMNLSGKAVRYWMQKEKIDKEHLLIITDDIHLDFGKVRLRGKGSDAGHNGIKDINQIIGSDYARIKVGIGAEFNKGRQVDYVLGEWTKEEQKDLSKILKHVGEAAMSFVSIGLVHAMSAYNR